MLSRIGDLPAAQQAYQRVRSLANAKNDPAAKATALGNLGTLARIRGDLEDAEELYKRSLLIEQELERKEGMADNYSNLGNLEKARGNPKAAQDYLIKARDLFDQIGMPHMVEKLQGWLNDLGR